MKFIHFQPVFFGKIYKKGLGLPTKNHSWVASNIAAKLSFQIILEFNGKTLLKHCFTALGENIHLHEQLKIT